jgi:hypothetical protein
MMRFRVSIWKVTGMNARIDHILAAFRILLVGNLFSFW